MNRLGFDELVDQLELKYANKGDLLLRTTLWWAFFGYAVLAMSLLVSFAIVGVCLYLVIIAPSFVTIKIGAIFGITAGAVGLAILRGVWVRLSRPEGSILTAELSPQLFNMIEEISSSAGGVKFDRVLLTQDMNAAVVQIPRAGIFGFHQNYLILGLPLMDALNVDEFKAVLAHEFAHLSNQHGRAGNWIYRIRLTWARVAENLAQQTGYLISPLQRFLGWFWPRFNARAFVLSRLNEYEADAFSAKVTSPEMAAAALRRVKFEARRLSENFWENIGKRSKNEPEPPLQIFQEMHDFFKTTSNLSITSHWMTQAFAVATDTSDTHPGLKDRVIALGVVPNYEVPDPVTHRASEALIPGALLVRERDAFSKAWADASREYWKSTFKENHEFRQRLDSIGNDSQIDSSNEWEKIVLLQNLEGMEAVLPQLNRLLERNPDHISAHYMLGCHLLAQDDSSGIDHLERVTADPMSAMNCFGIMADFYDRHGNVDAVRALKMRADEFDDMVQQAMIGRNRVSTADNFESHGLDAAEVKKIAEIVADEALVHGAWIVQKSHELLPQWKHYVILLDIKASWFRFESVAFRNEILTRIVNQVSLDGYILAIDTKDNNRPVARKIWSIPNAKIFDRKNA